MPAFNSPPLPCFDCLVRQPSYLCASLSLILRPLLHFTQKFLLREIFVLRFVTMFVKPKHQEEIFCTRFACAVSSACRIVCFCYAIYIYTYIFIVIIIVIFSFSLVCFRGWFIFVVRAVAVTDKSSNVIAFLYIALTMQFYFFHLFFIVDI